MPPVVTAPPVASSFPSTQSCPKCAPMKGCTKIKCPMSCCAKGGSWFKKCGKPGTECEHTWQEGIDACASKFNSNHTSWYHLAVPSIKMNMDRYKQT